ncbi:MAG: ATP-binding protein [Pseudomonadota bacterium]
MSVTGLVFFAALTSACLSLGRLTGFLEGETIGVAWSSGVLLAAAMKYRVTGVLVAGIAYFVTELAWGMTPEFAAIRAVVHGAAAVSAALVMRRLLRRQSDMTFTREWIIFFVGTCTFAATAITGSFLLDLMVLRPAGGDGINLLLMMIVEPLGITGMIAVLSNLREIKVIRRDMMHLMCAFLLTAILVTTVGIVLHTTGSGETESTVIMLLAMPISIWLAMLPHSLGGALISLVGFNAALAVVLQHVSTPNHPEYILVAAGYLVLVVSFQLVHALNLDRIKATELIEAHNESLEKQVTQRTARLQDMTERAIAADEAKSEFLASMSHELRTPLNGVIGMADIMLAGNMSPESRSQVQIIHSSGLHLLNLINSVLDFSRLSHARPQGKQTVFELRALLSNTVAEVSLLDESRNLTLSLDIDEAVPDYLIGDAQALRQVLTNLLGNAAKFTIEGGVEVSARLLKREVPGVFVLFAVEDSGIGIAASDLKKVFEPFEQVERSDTRSYGGAGLGLAICNMLLRRMKSQMSVESVLGEGSRFSFELHLMRASAAEIAEVA